MEIKPHHALLTSSDNIDEIPAQLALETPHFDEESIRAARPAVPLEQINTKRLRRLALLLVCFSTLMGCALGIALSRYQKEFAQSLTPVANVRAQDSPTRESDPSPQPVAATEDATKNVSAVQAEPPAKQEAARVPNRQVVDGQDSTNNQDGNAPAKLRSAFDEWIAAANARDIHRQMEFYPETINAFYLKRNLPRAAVRAEKSRVFAHADLVDIKAAEPGISLSPDGRTATMRFRKKYAIEGGGEDRRGEVMQELRWVRTDDGWKIVSERDLRVIQ